VLRSWEKEFPGIGVQKSPDGPRFYRPSDLEQVRRIKALVFGEGLTLSGARRRLEETTATSPTHDAEVAEVLDALASDARTRIAHVRDGLRAILQLLSGAPGAVVVVDDYQLERSRAGGKRVAATGPARPVRSGTPAVSKSAGKRTAVKRSAKVKRGKRASA
jgi:DNA-binding transcriptional MerR regulator